MPSLSLWYWFGFTVLVIALAAVDNYLLNRSRRDPGLYESAASVALWCLVASGFAVFVWIRLGSKAGSQFLTGYLLEWSLSMDNLFVFAVIFRYFQLNTAQQRSVLKWGILGAVVMRLAFILGGAALIGHFRAVLPLFGVFLIYTAIKLANHSANKTDPANNPLIRFASRWLPLAGRSIPEESTDSTTNVRFFVRQAGRWVMTPMFLVLLVIESTDLVFALDSVPAIFGVTRDPFIVFTSNLFAILGLRSLYFLLAGFLDLFHYLHYGLAAILAFVGVKMIGEWYFAAELLNWCSLGVIVGLLTLAIVASMIAERKKLGTRNPPISEEARS